MTERLQVALVIEKPEDEDLLAKLQEKLAEYALRLDMDKHPGQQLLQKPNDYFKYQILSTVLKSGQAEYETVAGKISKEFPDAFNAGINCFPDAWAVIWDYCVNAGAHAIDNRTGQPRPL